MFPLVPCSFHIMPHSPRLFHICISGICIIDVLTFASLLLPPHYFLFLCKAFPHVGFGAGRCRQDIIPILSPPLRRRFRPQKPGFHHKTPLLPLIPFLPPKGGSHSLRKYHHRILLVSTILTTPHMSGSVHRRRRYGSCRFFVYSFTSPSKYGRSPSVL